MYNRRGGGKVPAPQLARHVGGPANEDGVGELTCHPFFGWARWTPLVKICLPWQTCQWSERAAHKLCRRAGEVASVHRRALQGGGGTIFQTRVRALRSARAERGRAC